MKCPQCGAEAAGNFCASCGSPLKLSACPSCGAPQQPASKFCTQCGAALSSSGELKARRSAAVPRRTSPTGVTSGPPVPGKQAGGGGGNLGWWVAGVTMVLLIIVAGYPVLRRATESDGGVGTTPGAGGAGGQAIDLASMSLEEQATRLFNRVMSSSSNGDTADVAFFLPKALVIYEELNPTDPDGLYHYALLHMVGEDYEAALAKAQEGLAQVPDYLLLLAVSGEASAKLGDTTAARGYYSRFLEVYDTEMGLLRPGYEHHQRIFPSYREEAEAFLAGAEG